MDARISRSTGGLIGFTVGLAIVACVVFGLLPALRATRTAARRRAEARGRGLTADRGRFLVRRVLVVGQIAVSLALVVGSLLFIRTLRNLGTSDFGFSDHNVLVAELDLRPAGVAPEALLPFQAEAPRAPARRAGDRAGDLRGDRARERIGVE